MSGPNVTCRHCGVKWANRPKRLCWKCSFTPGVPALYESESKFGRRGSGVDTQGGFALPDAPTPAPPGTGVKVAELHRRASARVALHHPRDRRGLPSGFRPPRRAGRPSKTTFWDGAGHRLNARWAVWCRPLRGGWVLACLACGLRAAWRAVEADPRLCSDWLVLPIAAGHPEARRDSAGVA